MVLNRANDLNQVEDPAHMQDGHAIPRLQSASEVVRDIETIFRMAPPMLHAPKGGSDSTREPAFYDTHLSEDLLMKKVVFSPNFTDQLGNVANAALRQATLPPKEGTGWISAVTLEEKLKFSGDNISAPSEQAVVSAYRCNVYENIEGIASALEFPSSSWESQFIDMHISDPKGTFTGADQRLKHNYALSDGILTLNPDRGPDGVPHDSEIVQDIKTVINYYFERVVPFEFKSLSSGSYKTMLCILQHTLMETFPWERCRSPYCAYEHAPELGRKPITGDPLGFDANFPDVHLETAIWDGKHQMAVNKRDKKYPVHARNMLQQIWSQMVKYDTTFAVLHAGTYELIFARDRKKQFLYVSDLIEPQKIGKENAHEPGYYQIHIGLYITAIRDAVDRAKQLKKLEDRNIPLPTHWTRPFDCRYGRFSPVPTSKPELRHVATTYPRLCLAWHKSNDSPATFIPHRPYHRNDKPTVHGEFFFIEARKSTEPNVHIGTLIYREHRFDEVPIVIRTATGQKATKKLYFEYHRHVSLSQEAGLMVQKPYGFFSINGNSGVLLLQYVGTAVTSLRHLKDHQRMSIQNSLKFLHGLKYVHRQISRGSIYLDDTVEGWKRHGTNAAFPWLVNLSRVKRETDHHKHKWERARLRGLIKRAEVGGPNPSYPVLLGPLTDFVADPHYEFITHTHWMEQKEWITKVRCSFLEAPDGNTFLQIKFTTKEHKRLFMETWDSQNPPPKICCSGADFLISSEPSSRACSEALSPESSQGVMERNSQPMVIN